MRNIKALFILAGVITFIGCQNLEDKTDKLIIGKWKVIKVEANFSDVSEELESSYQKVAMDNKYEFNKENSYTITNNENKEEGVWEYKDDLNAILLKANGSDVYRDTLKIEAEDNDHVTFVNSSGASNTVRLKVERIK